MNAVLPIIWLVVFYLGLFVSFSSGGTCWSTMVKKKNGRCTELLHEKITKEECCASSNSVSTAWSPEEHDPSTLFFWRMLGGGVQCQSCRDSCTNVECETDKSCVLRKGIPKCVCSSICKDGKKKPKGPLCGTDGRTYRNWCRMRKKSCKQKLRNLSVAYYGVCQSSCDKIRCADNKTCLLDQNLSPHCVHCAKKKCPAMTKHRQVCGTNGHTYKSTCHLRNAACAAGRAVPIAYRGPCKANATCSNVQCHERQHCLIDHMATPGASKPRCVTCALTCIPKYLKGPICGSNNNTYPTWCHMMKDSCNKGYVIDTKYSGKCVGGIN
ncbi:follistatin isoform X2 [Anthonomus grandis grandis]|uniref:follistatin isoform X2 n=1 Tax=Anthonomus grandis grandis TaxID=2921223 RepID=UPI002165F18E|nr:follistatin isoform X2 [Anthonomus grandis grandis]